MKGRGFGYVKGTDEIPVRSIKNWQLCQSLCYFSKYAKTCNVWVFNTKMKVCYLKEGYSFDKSGTGRGNDSGLKLKGCPANTLPKGVGFDFRPLINIS